MKSASESVSLVGVVDGDDFAATHPETGNDVIGAYGCGVPAPWQ